MGESPVTVHVVRRNRATVAMGSMGMTPKQLSETAFAVDAGGGPVTLASRVDVLAVRWAAAAAEARAAYELWCGDPSAEGYSLYRAAADRADAAQDALAARRSA